MSVLSKEQIEKKLEEIKEWKLASEKEIERVYEFDDFLNSIGFINQVAEEAESMQHHPDIKINYNKVTLTLSTHDQGGLTEKDFNMAKKIDSIYENTD